MSDTGHEGSGYVITREISTTGSPPSFTTGGASNESTEIPIKKPDEHPSENPGNRGENLGITGKKRAYRKTDPNIHQKLGVKASRSKKVKRSGSSTRWLERAKNDPWAKRARQEGYRSRSAYKLLEIDDRFRLIKPGLRVLDLGAAPGSWLQVVSDRLAPGGLVVGVDLLPIEPLPIPALEEGKEHKWIHRATLQLDTTSSDADDHIRAAVKVLRPQSSQSENPAFDLILSDMRPNTMGVTSVDRMRMENLMEITLDIARTWIAPGGTLVIKILQASTGTEAFQHLRSTFKSLRLVKPEASRKESPEIYGIATGFRGK